MSAVSKLAEAIPQEIIGLVDPGSHVPTDDLRQALALLVGVWMWALVMRVLDRSLSAFADVLAGRKLVTRPGGFFSLVRKLSMIAVVALPAYSLLELLSGRDNTNEWLAATILASLLWVCLRAAVRDKVWLSADDRVIVIKKGFAIFSVKETSISLAETLYDAALRAPVGAEATGRPVYVSRAAVDALNGPLGGQTEAQQYLRAAVAAIGLVPAGRRFVAGRAAKN